MTTATKRQAGRSGASRPKGKATSSSRPGRRAPAKKNQSGKGGRAAGPGGNGRESGGLLASMGAVAAGHATDLWGVGLVTLGVLCAVAFYGGSLGPIGRGARVGMGDLLGWGRFLLPPVLIAVGVRMVMGRGDDLEGEQTPDRRRASSGHAAERVRREPARAVIGGTLVLLSVSSMAALPAVHLRCGPPPRNYQQPAGGSVLQLPTRWVMGWADSAPPWSSPPSPSWGFSCLPGCRFAPPSPA